MRTSVGLVLCVVVVVAAGVAMADGPVLTEQEPNNDPTHPMEVESETVVEGAITYEYDWDEGVYRYIDQDYIAVWATEGQYVEATIEMTDSWGAVTVVITNTTNIRTMDPVTVENGESRTLRIIARETGWHRVFIGAYLPGGETFGAGSYRLTLAATDTPGVTNPPPDTDAKVTVGSDGVDRRNVEVPPENPNRLGLGDFIELAGVIVAAVGLAFSYVKYRQRKASK
ncbi:hypothetical protein [Haloferax profundi]|uniref:Uncharacterized protein n=1 Tax=Haloferax profundi TaxID=1544718 RepID=A0A0W1SHE9_9EURY|nr:hypothetical protein [Haloferax profundi]KTG25592.1 hypothetical protein AUR66_00940 [Haloferax profundi]